MFAKFSSKTIKFCPKIVFLPNQTFLFSKKKTQEEMIRMKQWEDDALSGSGSGAGILSNSPERLGLSQITGSSPVKPFDPLNKV